jgi:hypothetical protein
MSSVMRTLLIARTNNNELLYGHSIVWELSELDYRVSNWKKFQSGEATVYFKDLQSEEVDAALKQGAFNLAPSLNVCISADLPESETFFIEKSYEENNFNPFTELCTFATAHFRELPEGDDTLFDFLHNNQNSFAEIKDRFHIDLEKMPHLLGTFTVFRPTRIEENFKGFQNDTSAGYKIHLHDYFELYEGATVRLESIAGDNTHMHELKLNDELHIIDCGFVPDRHITTIELNGQTIYRSSFALLKHISISANIVEERKWVIGDKVIVQKRSSQDRFDV